MKKCCQCGKKGLFLKLNYRGMCMDCDQAWRAGWERKRNDGIREAKMFIQQYGEMVEIATKNTTILPSFGKAAISKQREACNYVLDHINDWQKYEYFAEAADDASIIRSGYSIPLLFDIPISAYSTSDFEKLFANLEKKVSDIHTHCILAEYKYYDYSELYHVVGVTFKNGRRNRQTILRQIKFHDAPYKHDPTFRLERYLYEGEDAVAVYADDEQVGNISKYDLPWLIEHFDEFYCVDEYEVVGGGGLSYGLWIRACFRKKEDSHI